MALIMEMKREPYYWLPPAGPSNITLEDIQASMDTVHLLNGEVKPPMIITNEVGLGLIEKQPDVSDVIRRNRPHEFFSGTFLHWDEVPVRVYRTDLLCRQAANVFNEDGYEVCLFLPDNMQLAGNQQPATNNQ